MKKICLSLGVICSIMLLTACGSQEGEKTTEQTQAQPSAEVKSYIVATDPTYAPFEFKNETGNAIGFDIDLLNAIAEKQNLSFKYINVSWAEMFSRLNNGTVDILANGIAATEERKKTVDFSSPYLETYGVVATLGKNKISKVEELAGKPIAVITGDYNISLLEKALGKDLNLKKENTLFLCLKALQTDQATAVAGNVHVLRFYANNYAENLNEVPLSEERNNLAFAVAKDQPELLKEINQGLEKIKADGTYQKISEKWFGTVR